MTDTALHRTYLGVALAMVLPLALSLHWLVSVPVLWGLWRTCCRTAWLAAAVGLALWNPWTVLATGVVGSLLAHQSWETWTMPRWVYRDHDTPADRWLRVGSSMDGLRARLISWSYLVYTWRPAGAGWHGTREALCVAYIRGCRMAMMGPPARNEPLQFSHAYGIVGVVVVCGVSWALMRKMMLGDPLSAAVLTGLVGACSVSIFRSWLTGLTFGGLSLWLIMR